jgi:flagellar hook-associated protein 3 FlgL
MRVSTNSVSENMVRQIQQLGTQQAKLQNQVATGQRVSQPEDDPAAVGRVLNLETEQRQIARFQANASHALDLSQASYSGIQAIKKVSDRASEIGTLGAGVVSPAAAQAYATEVDQLIEQTVQLANSRFGNDYLYAGTAVGSAPFVAARDSAGKVTSVTYAGDSNRAAIPLSEATNLTPTTDGTTNLGLRDFLNQLVSLRDALNANNTSAVTTVQTSLIGSEDLLVSSLAEHGGVQTRIEATQGQLADRALSLESLVSNETEADLPSTIVKLNQTQTAYQAALQSAANIMKISLLDYIR